MIVYYVDIVLNLANFVKRDVHVSRDTYHISINHACNTWYVIRVSWYVRNKKTPCVQRVFFVSELLTGRIR